MLIINQLSIRSKFIIFMLIVSLTSLITIGIIGYQSGQKILKQSAAERLQAIRIGQSQKVEDYFHNIENELLTLSKNQMVIDAMRQFRIGYNLTKYNALSKDEAAMLDQFYQKKFLPELQKHSNIEPIFKNLRPKSTAASYLQYHYIVQNQNTPSKKDLAQNIDDANHYNKIHLTYHYSFKEIAERLKFYNLCLINDETGEIVYSVFKESDFATSLMTGPYRYSHLASLVKKINTSHDREHVHMEDFAKYRPSYNNPAAFLGISLYDGDEKLGILAVQIPIDPINNLMTFQYDWQGGGLGTTGESYLIGEDMLMRSTSRLFLEDQKAYVEKLKDLKVPQKEIDQILRANTTVINQKISTTASTRALAGLESTHIIRNYFREKVLSTYARLTIFDHKWAIITEMGISESQKQIFDFQKKFFMYTILIVFLVTMFALIIARSFTKPLNELLEGVKQIEEGKTDISVSLNTNDEFKELSDSFNLMARKIKEQKELIETKERENKKLLLNIMPEPIMERYLNGETRIGDNFQNITVLFSALTGVSKMYDHQEPEQAIKLFNELISAFDLAAEKHGIEKIKTIGDNYMGACGITTPRFDHARRTVDFAKEMIEIIKRFNHEHHTNLFIRIGISSGNVIAGLVGDDKLTYDLWGDTVDIASNLRYESSLNGICVNKSTYENLGIKEEFKACENVELKGVGKVESWQWVISVHHPLTQKKST